METKEESRVITWMSKNMGCELQVFNGKCFLFSQPLFAFEYNEVFPENGWKVFDPVLEYRRQVGTCVTTLLIFFILQQFSPMVEYNLQIVCNEE